MSPRSLKDKVYDLIKSSGLILESILEEEFDGSTEEFFDSGKIEDFFKLLPKENIKLYLEKLNVDLRGNQREINSFKSYMRKYGKFLYSDIIEGIAYDINKKLYESLSENE